MISGRMTWFSGSVKAARVGQTRDVGGVGVAGAGQILLLALGVRFDRDGGIGDVVDLEEVGQVQLGRGAGLDADRRAVQFLGRGHAQLLLHHEALAVVVVHADEIELEVGVAREGPGRVAGQHVDFARSQRGKAGLAGGRHELDLGGSPRTAAATARHTATSKPDQLPLASGSEKPVRPVVTPQFSSPRAFTSSTVPAEAKPATMAAAESVPRNTDFFILTSS
jgi:hypothetical protein